MSTKSTLRVSFTILEKQITQMLRFNGEDNAEQKSNKNSHARKSGFCSFLQVKANCDTTKPYNKSLINLVFSVCTGKYCLRLLLHRPRYFVARSVRKTSGNTFPFLIYTDYYSEKNYNHIYIEHYQKVTIAN